MPRPGKHAGGICCRSALDPTREVFQDDEEPEVLGIWTSHIALLFGKPLKGADIQTIYPRAESSGQGS